MKILIEFSDASVRIQNNEDEGVYAAYVENYSVTATPEKLVAAIADCAQDVIAAYEDAQSKLAASL